MCLLSWKLIGLTVHLAARIKGLELFPCYNCSLTQLYNLSVSSLVPYPAAAFIPLVFLLVFLQVGSATSLGVGGHSGDKFTISEIFNLLSLKIALTR